tara:strand:- start:23 stop:157 length:135 start_codon:yes stop_codon:yes gene_type:complete
LVDYVIKQPDVPPDAVKPIPEILTTEDYDVNVETPGEPTTNGRG